MANPTKLFDNEMCYTLLMQIADAALENGHITPVEYEQMKQDWIQKYNPPISSLLLDI